MARGLAEELQEFGQRFRELRLRANKTQPELAAELGVKRQTIASWEQGTTTPDVRSLLLLKQSLGATDHFPVDLTELIGERRTDSGRSPLEYAVRLLQRIDLMGLRDVHANRSDALNAFIPFIERERSSICVVASSFLGVTRVAAEKVSGLLQEKVAQGVELRILMTHPDMSALRETQEGRASSTIRQEIRESVRTLRSWNVKDESIRFYHGAPTIFLLFTPERMLANPYTYQTEAFKTVTLELAPTTASSDYPNDIYSQYAINHFRRPWASDSSKPLSQVESVLEERGVQLEVSEKQNKNRK